MTVSLAIKFADVSVYDSYFFSSSLIGGFFTIQKGCSASLSPIGSVCACLWLTGLRQTTMQLSDELTTYTFTRQVGDITSRTTQQMTLLAWPTRSGPAL